MGGRESLEIVAALSKVGPVVAELVGLLDGGDVALVIDLDVGAQASARRARSIVELCGAHIGARVLLLHENGDPDLPIVVGVLRGRTGWPLADPPGVIEVQADGRRLEVSARDELTLRCGSARITLTRDGKVLIEGSYVSSHATGVNRVRGGSVHLN